MKKGILGLITWALPFVLLAQNNASTSLSMTEKGIKWTQGLTWEQVKEKAKQENKYIFLDCFATWCGPCKMMDKSTYVNDSVGKYFNEKFISVKVQMDKTEKDNEQVKVWYKEAESMNNQYHIEAFPTFVFLSPDRKRVKQETGFKSVSEFIALGKSAIVPGLVYDDPFEEFDKFIADYRKSIKHFDKMPEMVKIAVKLHKNDLALELLKDYDRNYVFNLPKKQRYTKETIELWSSFLLSSKTQVFKFFYKDGKRIDKVMGEKGYAAKVVDQTINHEIIMPFFEKQNKDSSIALSGMYLTGKNLPSNNSEADWDKLKKLISNEYSNSYAKRNVLAARVEWYHRHWNWPAYFKYRLLQLDQYGIVRNENLYTINNDAFDAFTSVNDKKILKGYIKWMEKLGVASSTRFTHLDTYANLLYKIGKTDDAIKWEEKAIQLAPEEKGMKEALENMKKGEPTYGVVLNTK